MIELGTGFEVLSTVPLDSRMTLTKEQMRDMLDSLMPETYFCVCADSDDNAIYLYSKSNDKDPITGRFRLFESGGGGADNQLILNDMNEWYALSFEEREKYLNCEIIIIHAGIYVYKIDSYGDHVLEPIAAQNDFPNGLYTSQIAAYKGEDDDFTRSRMYFTDQVEIHTGKNEEDVNEATLTVQDNKIEFYVTDNGEPQWDSRLTFDTGGVGFYTHHNGNSYKSGSFSVDGPDIVFSTSSESSDDSIKLDSREIFLNTYADGMAYVNDKAIATIDDIPDVSTKLNVAGDNATAAGVSALINTLTEGTSDPVDNDYYVAQYADGGTTTTTYHRRKVSALWNYIKGKISSVLGLTANKYSGASSKVVDYGDTNRTISIGYAGTGVTAETATHIAAYTENGTKIKDMSFDELQKKVSVTTHIGTVDDGTPGCIWIE